MTRQQIIRFVATKFFREYGFEFSEKGYKELLRFFDSLATMDDDQFVQQMRKAGFEVKTFYKEEKCIQEKN